jgi:hypothetical protein
MNLDVFPSVCESTFSVPSAIAFLGQSNAGKTVLLSRLLEPRIFQARFGVPLSNCKRVTLVFNTFQHIYDKILANFSCPHELLTKLSRDLCSDQYWNSGGGGFSLLIWDDALSMLTKESLSILETLLTVTMHHCNLVVITLQQSLTGTGSQQLRSLLRHYNYFCVFASTDALSTRYIGSMVMSQQAKFISSIVTALSRKKGSFCIIDCSLREIPYRVLWLNINTEPRDAIDVIFCHDS